MTEFLVVPRQRKPQAIVFVNIFEHAVLTVEIEHPSMDSATRRLEGIEPQPLRSRGEDLHQSDCTGKRPGSGIESAFLEHLRGYEQPVKAVLTGMVLNQRVVRRKQPRSL